MRKKKKSSEKKNFNEEKGWRDDKVDDETKTAGIEGVGVEMRTWRKNKKRNI